MTFPSFVEFGVYLVLCLVRCGLGRKCNRNVLKVVRQTSCQELHYVERFAGSCGPGTEDIVVVLNQKFGHVSISL